MIKRIVIAISGLPGAGKSTYAKLIAKELNLRYFSAGQIFRKMAFERGISLEEFHKVAMRDENIDKAVDNLSIKEARRGGVVIDGHISGWILRDLAHLKIYFTAPLEVRAKRISIRDNISLKEAKKSILKRERLNYERYKKIYNIDVRDLRIYDLVINTALWDIKFVKLMLINAIKNMIRS